MSVLFSRSCEYGLQAVLYLAQQPPKTYTLIKEISGSLGIPTHFLAKILQSLTKSGLLTSNKGRGGGFALAVPAEKMTLLQVVQSIDGLEFARNCVMGFPDCSDSNPCPLHKSWAIIRAKAVQMLAHKTIAQLAEQVKLKRGKLVVKLH
ncbi:MAG: RrF2 family transcriptional regulator [Bacteroidota bacterium]